MHTRTSRCLAMAAAAAMLPVGGEQAWGLNPQPEPPSRQTGKSAGDLKLKQSSKQKSLRLRSKALGGPDTKLPAGRRAPRY